MKRNNLDEMQEQALLHIEHNGCWFAYWGLLAAIIIQSLLGMPGKETMGEWIVFMAMSLYLIVASLRKGIWDRHLRANRKTNLVVSLLAGIATGVFTAVRCSEHVQEPLDLLLIGCIPAVFTFALCFAALSICTRLYQKRRTKLDAE